MNRMDSIGIEKGSFETCIHHTLQYSIGHHVVYSISVKADRYAALRGLDTYAIGNIGRPMKRRQAGTGAPSKIRQKQVPPNKRLATRN